MSKDFQSSGQVSMLGKEYGLPSSSALSAGSSSAAAGFSIGMLHWAGAPMDAPHSLTRGPPLAKGRAGQTQLLLLIPRLRTLKQTTKLPLPSKWNSVIKKPKSRTHFLLRGPFCPSSSDNSTRGASPTFTCSPLPQLPPITPITASTNPDLHPPSPPVWAPITDCSR